MCQPGVSHLVEDVGNEGVGLQVVQVVIVGSQHGEQLTDVLETLQQDACVCVKETQGEPLKDEVKVCDGLRRVTCARLL